MEDALEEAKAKAGREALSEMLAQFPAEDGGPKPCPQCARAVFVRQRNVRRTLDTLSGTQTFHRHYHYCEGCSFGFYPRDAELGLPNEGAISLELERRVLDFALNSTFEECAERWKFHYGTELSENLFRRVVERVAECAKVSDRGLL